MALTMDNKKSKMLVLAIRSQMKYQGFFDAAENFYNRAMGQAGDSAYPPRQLEWIASHWGVQIST